jgi:hypothetical protein
MACYRDSFTFLPDMDEIILCNVFAHRDNFNVNGLYDLLCKFSRNEIKKKYFEY